MKTALKRILSFVCILCIAFIGVFVMPTVTANAATTTDVLTRETTGVTSTTYNSWSGKEGQSGAVYAGQSAGGNTSIQLRSDNNNSGVITTASGGKAKKVVVEWNSNTTSGRTLDIYGKNTAYSNPTELYNSSSQGTKIGSIVKGTSTELTISGDYAYIGMRSSSKAMYLTSISITWESVSTGEPSVSVKGESNVAVGETLTLTAEAQIVSGTPEWTSSNTNVATVDANGVVTPKTMGKTTITATVGTTSGTKDIVVYPEAGSVLSIAEAIEVCKLTGETNAPYTYSTTGIIESIDENYNTQHSNITVTIMDGTGSIKAYRMTGGAELAVGDNITITGTLVNYMGNTPEFAQGCTFVQNFDDATADIIEELNKVKASMQLKYSYKATKEMQEVPSKVDVTDTMNTELIGTTGTAYTAWSGKKSASSAEYAGKSITKEAEKQIQLNYNTSTKPGIVTTVSGGKATKITINWGGTAAGRILNVYGKNTAYGSAADLYDDNKGTLIGTIECGESTELDLGGEYAYIAFTSAKSAMYLEEIQITWASEGSGGMKEVEVLSGSEFFIKCAVDASLLDIEGVDSVGIQVSIPGKAPVKYTTEAKSWTFDEKNNLVYVVIDLGDIINDMDKMNTQFTVQAFVVVGEDTYCSTQKKSLSVADMVKAYYEAEATKDQVAHLYEYLF